MKFFSSKYVLKGKCKKCGACCRNILFSTKEGYVKDEKLYIGDAEIMKVGGVADRNVTVAIRPEGFNLVDNGPLVCELSNVEVMGRDVSIVSRHASSLNPVLRSIINADNKIDVTSATVSFSLKPHKVFLFDAETEERIYFEV